MEIYSIGFTQTTAENFFGRLRGSGVQRLLDVRRNTSSQLAGFAKARDLPYFLRELLGAEYAHEPGARPGATGERGNRRRPVEARGPRESRSGAGSTAQGGRQGIRTVRQPRTRLGTVHEGWHHKLVAAVLRLG